jgi:FkbM family methyltransferase
MILSRFLTALPDFRGKRQLTRLLFGNHIKRQSNKIIKGLHGIRYKVPNCVEIIGFEIFVNGIYEKATSDFIIKHLPHNGVYIDIGANIGGIAFPIAKKRPDVTVVCVEASLNVFTYLEQNMQLNKLSNCILVNKAISDVDDQHIEIFTPQEHFGKGCLIYTEADSRESVTTTTVDTLTERYDLENISLLKVDIEGYEYYAFKGAEKLLSAPNAPDIVFEFENYAEVRAGGVEPGDAQRLLLEYGYKLFMIEKNNKLISLPAPKVEGCAMIWATKKI